MKTHDQLTTVSKTLCQGHPCGEIATMSRSSGEQPHDVKNTKEQALHQAQTMKTHKNVVCSQAIANRKKG